MLHMLCSRYMLENTIHLQVMHAIFLVTTSTWGSKSISSMLLVAHKNRCLMMAHAHVLCNIYGVDTWNIQLEADLDAYMTKANPTHPSHAWPTL